MKAYHKDQVDNEEDYIRNSLPEDEWGNKLYINRVKTKMCQVENYVREKYHLDRMDKN